MATTSSTTAASTASTILSSLNSGGIDWTTLATNLSVAQFATKTDQLTTRSTKLDTQISTASSLKSTLLTLSTSIGTLVRSGDLSPQPSVANSSVASATLTGSTTPKGTFSLEVTKLAKSQTLTSPALTSATSVVGGGTLTLRFGTISGSTFTEDTSHTAASITVAAGATLTQVAAAINGANAGVTAYVANTAAGAKLVMKGQEGAANGFVLEAANDAADTSSPGLAQLAWEPSAGAASQLLQGSQDAAYTLDGLEMTSTSNTISEAIAGVKLKLTTTNIGSPTTVSFADNSSSIKTAAQDLTDALNELVSQVNTATDPLSGDLASDPGAKSLKRSLSQLSGTTIMENAASGDPKTLADLGISIQRDGTFALDSSKLSSVLASNPTGVAAMFTNGIYGIYATVDKLNRQMASSTDANSLASSVNRYTKAKTQVTTDLSDIATKQETLRQTLVTRFSKTQTNVAASTSTMTFLKNQIDAWNSSSN